jgi:hypothetical protein
LVRGQEKRGQSKIQRAMKSTYVKNQEKLTESAEK